MFRPWLVSKYDKMVYGSTMSDRLFFTVCAVASVLMVALALVWPQGLGKRSPRPFGHRPVYQVQAEAEAAAAAAKAKAKAPPPVHLHGPL